MDASAVSRLRQQWSGQLEVDASCPASEPALAAARAFIDNHHLHDQEVEYLWNARNGSNPASDLVIKVTYETKSDSNLRLAMKVTVPTIAGEILGTRTHSTVARVALDPHAWFGEAKRTASAG